VGRYQISAASFAGGYSNAGQNATDAVDIYNIMWQTTHGKWLTLRFDVVDKTFCNGFRVTEKNMRVLSWDLSVEE
jgi:hypothetical protein